VKRDCSTSLKSIVTSTRPLRIAYMAGPGNVLGAYECLERGERDTTNSHVGYSELMLHACMSVGASELLALTTHPSGGYVREDINIDGLRVIVERIEDDFAGKSGLAFHAANWAFAKQVRAILDRFHPDVLIVGDDPPRAAALRQMVPPGCRLVRVHHCAPTPHLVPASLKQRILLGIDSIAMYGRVDAILSASSVVTKQVRQLFPGTPVAEFLPHFDAELHEEERPMPSPSDGLRCVFVGRALRSKGIFDILEAAKILRQAGERVSFDICGDGEGFAELERQVRAANLGSRFVLHGWCDRAKMADVMARAHVGLTPTRSEFAEGFCQSAIELILRRLPVVASHAIPAASYMGRAVSVVPHDDPVALALELAHLSRSPETLLAMHAQCAAAAAKFLRRDTSYEAAMTSVLESLARGKRPRDRLVSFDGEVSQ